MFSDEKSSLRDPDGRLSFRAGNICNHFFTTPFLRRVCGSRSDPESKDRFRLPWHVAKKKIPYADPETGETVKPEQVNGIKLERFVFDVFQVMKKKGFMFPCLLFFCCFCCCSSSCCSF